MSPSLVLPPAGNEIIDLFGDGSYQDLISLGSWAFYVPGLALKDAGVEEGFGIDQFEMMSLLAGLSAIISIDQTQRPVRIVTDSDCAMLLLKHAIEGTALPIRPVFHRVRHLYDQTLEMASRRRLLPQRTGLVSPPEHKRCHKLAYTKLRDAIAADPSLNQLLTIRREQRRFQEIQKQIRVFVKQANAIQDRLQQFGEPIILPLTAANAARNDSQPLAIDVVRIRQAAALDVLNSLAVLRMDDELTIRQQFGLPITCNLWDSTFEKAAGSTDCAEFLEPDTK